MINKVIIHLYDEKGEYSYGQHQFRLKLEERDSDKWFFWIISKNVSRKVILISTPTAYGFAGHDGICLNGVYQNTNN
ncbi:unnamed protein product [Rotaria sp. Silwood2]|nr:unnamed protein product [Rotaria sp. Silwood2]CAF2931010.1 unnamed protein product [Rotaria sp. Silwood2]CAF4436401.1 unnamed protein product [Rotaria sp. Silwood2]CAF4471070.1 unnamed protein product [Rotaria sp. Silwood2]